MKGTPSNRVFGHGFNIFGADKTTDLENIGSIFGKKIAPPYLIVDLLEVRPMKVHCVELKMLR